MDIYWRTSTEYWTAPVWKQNKERILSAFVFKQRR
jgi:hypothetical protein